MTIEELEVLVETAEAALRAAKEDLRAAVIAASPYQIDQVIKNRNGEEAKVVRLVAHWSNSAAPVVVYRKKNGEWGSREYTLYSWDLPEQAA